MKEIIITDFATMRGAIKAALNKEEVMKEVKHTPGPWFVNGEDEPTSGVPALEIMAGEIFTKSCKSIAYVNSTLQGVKFKITDIDEANAALIAAAPELLETLESLMNEIDARGYHNDFSKQRAIIAKAKGKL